MTDDRFPEDLRRRATYFAADFLPDTDPQFENLVYHMCRALEMERCDAFLREERLRALGDDVICKLIARLPSARAPRGPVPSQSGCR